MFLKVDKNENKNKYCLLNKGLQVLFNDELLHTHMQMHAET